MATKPTPGAWDEIYEGDVDAQAFGGLRSYEVGAEFLADCELVEDWGCGRGWMRTLVEPERYRGIDGSASPFADEVVDLAHYSSEVPGIFMRHVLEHDWRWAQILRNAMGSFTERMVLVMFAAGRRRTREIGIENHAGVPVIGFRTMDLLAQFRECHFETVQVEREQTEHYDSLYDETVFLIRRIA